MELIFLDGAFAPISAPIDRFYSLVWIDKYYDHGTFELHIADDYIDVALRAEYIYNNDADEAMVIQNIEYSKSERRTLKINGQALSALLHRRVMDNAESYTGTAEEAARRMVKKYAIDGDRAIPLLSLGAAKGYTDLITASNERGVRLDEWLRDLLTPLEMTYRLHYDYEDNALVFDIFRGLDRTQSQDLNTWAIFSSSYENIAQFGYSRNRADYYNYAIIVSGNGNKRTTVDKSNGEARRELYIESDDALNVADMQKLGATELANNAMIEMVECKSMTNINLVYGRDYAIGDICNVEDQQSGVSAAIRLTEMTTVVEDGCVRRAPSFGRQYLDLRQWIAHEVGNASTGTFQIIKKIGELPPEYTELSYIECTDTLSYIDTGYVPTTEKLRIICNWRYTNANFGWGSVFGSQYFLDTGSGVTSQCSIVLYGNQPKLYVGDTRAVDIGWDIAYNQDYVIDIIANNGDIQATLNGTVYLATYSGELRKDYSIALFGSNVNGAITEGSILRMYRAKIIDNDVLVRDMLPCRRNSDNICGMYDLIGGQFYESVGSIEFQGG